MANEEQENGGFLGWLKENVLKPLVCWVVTIIKVIVLLIIVVTVIMAVWVVGVGFLGSAFCLVAGVWTWGVGCVIAVIVAVILYLIIIYFLMKWAFKILMEEIIELHCTVFD